MMTKLTDPFCDLLEVAWAAVCVAVTVARVIWRKR